MNVRKLYFWVKVSVPTVSTVSFDFSLKNQQFAPLKGLRATRILVYQICKSFVFFCNFAKIHYFLMLIIVKVYLFARVIVLSLKGVPK